MPLKAVGIIDIPDSTGTLFDHGAFEPRSRRVFVAHTARDRIKVIDHDTSRHLATLQGFPEAAGVVADEGQVLITNRGAARLVHRFQSPNHIRRLDRVCRTMCGRRDPG